MADVYVDARRMYINVMSMNDKDEEYEEEMRTAVEEYKREEQQKKER